MNGILITQDSGKILGPISKILGIVINWIFNLLDVIGIPSVGLAIIIFTFIIYILLLPLTFKQQKFSKMSAIMNPEIQAIQAKYKGKNDSESMTKQNEELQAVYKKYGVSPTGSCIQLLIQMPILFALYRVIYNMPAYVTKVYDSLSPLAEKIINTPGGSDFVKNFSSAIAFKKNDFTLTNTIIDVLNRSSVAEWESLKTQFPDLLNTINQAQSQFLKYYNFLGINIAESPANLLKTGFSEKAVLMIIGAISIPALAAITQWLNVLFMPQPSSDDPNNSMAASMKTMNLMMPIMSAVFCYSLPAGMGIYWIASAVIRSVEQVAINKYFDKTGIDEIIRKNQEKAAKKEEKQKEVSSNSIKSAASKKTRNYDSIKNIPEVSSSGKEPKAGSMASKANLVKKYNERGNE